MPVSVGDAGAARRAASSASGPPKVEVLVLMVACCWVVVGIVVNMLGGWGVLCCPFMDFQGCWLGEWVSR